MNEDRPYGIIDAYEDQHNLMSLATEAIAAALIDGQLRGYTDEWKEKVDIREHLQHASDHVKSAEHHNIEKSWEQCRENLFHAVCRITMALWHLDMREMDIE